MRPPVADHEHETVLASGARVSHFAAAGAAAAVIVSISPPIGQRDERFPLRGRDQLLETLVRPAGVTVAYGMGGSGKTSLALEIAWRAMRRGVEVWWGKQNGAK